MGVAIYARISTKDKGQEYENQVRDLRAYIAARKKEGWRLAHEYLDQASGKDTDRRQFARLFDLNDHLKTGHT